MFGPVGQIWSFGITTTGLVPATGNPGTFTVQNQGTSTVSFTANAIPGAFVPEPATLAVCGFFGIAGLVAAGRKLKKTAEPTVAA